MKQRDLDSSEEAVTLRESTGILEDTVLPPYNLGCRTMLSSMSEMSALGAMQLWFTAVFLA